MTRYYMTVVVPQATYSPSFHSLYVNNVSKKLELQAGPG